MIDFKSVFSLNDNRARLLVRNAKAALQRGEFNESAGCCTRAIELRPAWVIAYAQRAHAWILLKKYDEAIHDCSTALSHDPDCAVAYNNRSVAYSALNRRGEALADIECAVRLAPHDGQFLANCGIEHYKAGNVAAAIDELLRALRLNPAQVPARINLAAAYASLGKDDAALEQLGRAIHFQPANAAAYKLRGDIHARQHKHAAAVREYNAALKRGFAPAIGLVMRAQPLHSLGHDDDAIRDLTESIRLSPNFFPFLLRSNVFASRGETAKAVADANEALRLLGDDTTNYGQRGLAYLRAGDFDRALADFERMIEREPETGLHYNNRGYIRQQRGDYEQAIVDYETAIHLSELPNAYKNLATLRANCAVQSYRDGSQAIALAERALELAGGQPREWLCVVATAYAEADNMAMAAQWLRKANEPPPRVVAPPIVVGTMPSQGKPGPFQFTLGETLLVLTVLAVLLSVSSMFWHLDDFMESFGVPGMMTLIALYLIYVGGRRCGREIRRREPGNRAYYLGLACGAPVGLFQALSWYVQFIIQYDVATTMKGFAWLLLLHAASSAAVLTCLYAFLGGVTAAAIDHGVDRLRGVQKLHKMTLD